MRGILLLLLLPFVIGGCVTASHEVPKVELNPSILPSIHKMKLSITGLSTLNAGVGLLAGGSFSGSGVMDKNYHPKYELSSYIREIGASEGIEISDKDEVSDLSEHVPQLEIVIIDFSCGIKEEFWSNRGKVVISLLIECRLTGEGKIMWAENFREVSNDIPAYKGQWGAYSFPRSDVLREADGMLQRMARKIVSKFSPPS